MATRPWIAWKTPVMSIMIAANRMNPTAMPLVCRPAREYASLLTADPSSASDDRPHHGTCGGCRHYPFWDELCWRCAAARAPLRLGMCPDHQFDKLQGDTQQGGTFEKSRRRRRCSSRSAHAAGAEGRRFTPSLWHLRMGATCKDAG